MSVLPFSANFIDCWICTEPDVNIIEKNVLTKNSNNYSILEVNIFCTWNVWYNTNFDYENSLRCIVQNIGTLDQLEQELQRMPPIEKLHHGSNLYFFKSYITPRWEDRWNKSGARCLVPIHQTLFSDVPRYEMWYDMLKRILNLSEKWIFMINGISFSKRKDHKDVISLWINPYYDIKNKEHDIVRIVSQIFCINPQVLQYKKHPIT